MVNGENFQMSCTDTHLTSVRIHGMAMQWERDSKLYNAAWCMLVCVYAYMLSHTEGHLNLAIVTEVPW